MNKAIAFGVVAACVLAACGSHDKSSGAPAADKADQAAPPAPAKPAPPAATATPPPAAAAPAPPAPAAADPADDDPDHDIRRARTLRVADAAIVKAFAASPEETGLSSDSLGGKTDVVTGELSCRGAGATASCDVAGTDPDQGTWHARGAAAGALVAALQQRDAIDHAVGCTADGCHVRALTCRQHPVDVNASTDPKVAFCAFVRGDDGKTAAAPPRRDLRSYGVGLSIAVPADATIEGVDTGKGPTRHARIDDPGVDVIEWNIAPDACPHEPGPTGGHLLRDEQHGAVRITTFANADGSQGGVVCDGTLGYRCIFDSLPAADAKDALAACQSVQRVAPLDLPTGA